MKALDAVKVVAEDEHNHAVHLGTCNLGGGMAKKDAERFANEVRAGLAPFVALRNMDTGKLEDELKARRRCVDCQTECSSGWHAAGTNRVRCEDCKAKKETA